MDFPYAFSFCYDTRLRQHLPRQFDRPVHHRLDLAPCAPTAGFARSTLCNLERSGLSRLCRFLNREFARIPEFRCKLVNRKGNSGNRRRDARRATIEAVRRFALFAWSVLGFNLLVILWGALVRASR